jgi:hypothetical protein
MPITDRYLLLMCAQAAMIQDVEKIEKRLFAVDSDTSNVSVLPSNGMMAQ